MYRVHGRFLQKKYRSRFNRTEPICRKCFHKLNMPFVSVLQGHEMIRNGSDCLHAPLCKLCKRYPTPEWREAVKCYRCRGLIPSKEENAVCTVLPQCDEETEEESDVLSDGSVDDGDSTSDEFFW
jgi:polyferredoxin